MKSALFQFLAAVICCSLFYRCEQGPVDTVADKQPSITGKLLKPDGVTPAAGAVVMLQHRDALAAIGGAGKKSVFPEKKLVQTSADGTFSIDSCLAGVYALEGADDEGNAVRIDSVVVADPLETTTIPVQPLKSTGAVRGVVSLDNGGDPSNVFILVFGSDRFVQANSDGSFLMQDLPYGNYTLKIVCVLKEFGNSRTVPVTIQPGVVTDIDTVIFTVPVVCVPENVTLSYDSVKMAVILQWDPCNDVGIGGYNIYRYNNAEAEQYPISPLNPSPISAVNTFIDLDIYPDQVYTYGVAAVSGNGSVGRKAGPLSVGTRSSAFDVDTIPFTNSKRVLAVYWDADDQLQVATAGERILIESSLPSPQDSTIPTILFLSPNLAIDYYNNDLSFDHRVPIADTVELDREILLREDYLLFGRSFRDTLIYCYDLDGNKRYTFTLHRTQILDIDERNDTLYLTTDSRDYEDGTVSSAAYDTSGNLLFTIGGTSTPRIQKSKNDNLYYLGKNYNNNIISYVIKRFFPETNTFTEIVTLQRLSESSYFRDIKVSDDFYYLSNSRELSVYNQDGILHSRFISRNGFSDQITIDSKERIAIIDSNTGILILTPR